MNNDLLTRQAFAPRCPAGGTWWSCGYGTYFVGCCARDPCQITCAQGNLYPGGFDPATYGTFPDATCGTGSKFYTCSAGETFWGCCKTNACSQGGCPDGDLEPAIMNRGDQLSAYHATGGSTTLTSATMTSPSATASSSSTTAISTTNDKDTTPIAAIAGGTVGGVLAIIAIAGLLLYYCCFVKRSRQQHGERKTPPNQPFKTSQHLPHPHDAPPDYTSPNPALYPHSHQPQSHPHPQPSYYAYTHPSHPLPPAQELPLSPMPSNPPQKHPPTTTPPRGPSELAANNPPSPSELDTPESTTPLPHQGDFKHVPSPLLLSPVVECESLRGGGDDDGYGYGDGDGDGFANKGVGRRSRFVEMRPWGDDDGEGDGYEGVLVGRGGSPRPVGVPGSPASMRSAWVAPRDWELRSSGGDMGGGREGVVSGVWGPAGHGLGVHGVGDMMGRLERLDEQRGARHNVER